MTIHKTLHFVLLMLLCKSTFILAQTGRAALPKSQHQFVVIAHRGEHLHSPENTLASTKAAIEAGADYVEVDLRTTKDSVLVILHDATVDRTTNGHGLLSKLIYAETQTLRTRDPKTGAITQEGIPLFDSILAVCCNKINIYLDCKDADAAKAYALIRKYKMEWHTIVYINTPAQFSAWQSVAPNMPLIVSLPESVRTAESLQRFLDKTPCAVLDGDWSDYTPALISTAANNKVMVWPDIQSATEFSHWSAALQSGFGGLQTDHPLEFIEWLQNRGIR